MSAGEQRLRLFVALAVPAEVQAGLAEVQRDLRNQLPPRVARWTRPENIHLTLHFLGDVDRARLGALTSSIAATAVDFGAPTLAAEGVGCFPDLRHPRVFWTEVRDADARERLAELHRRMATATAEFSAEPPETRFVGHITLARFKRISRREAEIIATFAGNAVNRRFGEWTASSVELIQSELSPEGSRYTRLALFPLSQGGAG